MDIDIEEFLRIAKRNKKKDVIDALAHLEVKLEELNERRNKANRFDSPADKILYHKLRILKDQLNRAIVRIERIERIQAKDKVIRAGIKKRTEQNIKLAGLQKTLSMVMEQGALIGKQAGARSTRVREDKKAEEAEMLEYVYKNKNNIAEKIKEVKKEPEDMAFLASAEAFKVEFLPETTPLKAATPAEEKSEEEKNKDVYKALGIEADVVEAKTKEVIEIAKKTPELAELPLKEVGDRLMEAFLRSKA